MPWEKSLPAPRDFTVGIAGTFDVKNYGDLLFPLIAAAALEQRDPRIQVVPFSVNGRSEPSWPFHVHSMQEMMASISSLSAMLIGGGQIVRFDKSYPVSTPENIDLPFAYWLTPAVLAAMIGKPVIWNAVGASVGWLHSAWHDALIRQVFAASYFIGVRDAVSRDDLAELAPDASIHLLPDTAFGLSRLWPLAEESAEFTNWRRALGLEGRYVAIQASAAVGKHSSMVESLLESMGNINAVVLPVCWCHGDRLEILSTLKGKVFFSREWPGPRLISEIIGRSELIVASSLHACITALSYGVPVAQVPIAWGRTKFALLDEFEGIAPIDRKEALSQLIHRGRRIEPRVVECADRLDRYWDEVKNVVLQPPVEHGNLSRTLMLSWAAKVCGDQKRSGFMRRFIASLRESLAGLFPRQRAALRRGRWYLKTSVGTAFRWITHLVAPPIAEPTAKPKSGAELPPVPVEGIATAKSLSEERTAC
jgi:lipopolysaccharide transport system ATP-binding protein